MTDSARHGFSLNTRRTLCQAPPRPKSNSGQMAVVRVALASLSATSASVPLAARCRPRALTRRFAPVAQICNLPYRRIAFGRARKTPGSRHIFRRAQAIQPGAPISESAPEPRALLGPVRRLLALIATPAGLNPCCPPCSPPSQIRFPSRNSRNSFRPSLHSVFGVRFSEFPSKWSPLRRAVADTNLRYQNLTAR
jgi:hypothetical protein